MNTGGADPRAAGYGARKLPFLGPPISGIEHLRRGAEPGQRIKQFIARCAIRRQPVARKAEPQGVAVGAAHIDRVALHPVRDAARFDRGDHLARGGGFETGIKQVIAGLAGQPHQDRQHHHQGRTAPQRHGALAPVRPVPHLEQRLHVNTPFWRTVLVR